MELYQRNPIFKNQETKVSFCSMEAFKNTNKNNTRREWNNNRPKLKGKKGSSQKNNDGKDNNG